MPADQEKQVLDYGPCPECGCHLTPLLSKKDPIDVAWQATCHGCGRSTEYYETQLEAVHAWANGNWGVWENRAEWSTQEGKRKYPPDGLYGGIPCTCEPNCLKDCQGQCGCRACRAANADSRDMLDYD
jgi:hypothetical protein